MDQRHHECFQLHLQHSPASVSDYTEMSGGSFAAKCTCRFDAAPCVPVLAKSAYVYKSEFA